jgi:membrane-associated phospholipid phosphatase
VAYVLMPAAPPWYAAKEGVIAEPVARVAGFGFGIVPVDTSTRWLEAQSNPVAAFPSLHAAFALLVVVALWPLARSWWMRLPLALFPLAMGFTLVYGGEHYAIDVFAGWAWVGLASLVAQAWERRLSPSMSTGG